MKNKIDNAYLNFISTYNFCSNISLVTSSNDSIMKIYPQNYYDKSEDYSYLIYKFDRETYGESFKFTRMDSSTQIFYNDNKYDLEQLKISIQDNPERLIIYNKDNNFTGDLQVNTNNNVAYVEVNGTLITEPQKFTIYMKNELGYRGPLFSELNSSTITLHTSNNDIFNINCKDYLEITERGLLKYEFNYNNSNIPFYFNSFKYSGNFNYNGKDIIFSEIDVYESDNFDSNHRLRILSNDYYLEKEKYYSIPNDNYYNNFYGIAYVNVIVNN